MENAKTILPLTRRGVLAGMAAFTAASCTPRGGSFHEVVVIGAGSAGIGAARTLKALGRDCLVIEAANRIGGRAFTDTRTFPMAFDIGCAWIHAGMTNPYYPMALERGYRLLKQDVDTLHELFYNGVWQGAPGAEQVKTAEEAIVDAAKTAARQGKDVSLASLMTICGDPAAAAATFMSPMDAAVDANRESNIDLTDEEGAEYDPNYLVKEGFGTLVADVGSGIPVSLSTTATAIHSEARGVRIETDRGTIRARAVIVTVSTGVLQKGAIRFDPALPLATQTAIDDLPMGLLTKIPLLVPGFSHYGQGIAPEENILNEVTPAPGQPPCAETPGNLYFLAWPWNSDLMVGFAGGNFAWSLAGRPDGEVFAYAVESLTKMYGSDIGKKVTTRLVTKWGTNPLTHGAYAAALPGRAAARDVLRLPVRERLFFAGEAAAEGGLFATCGGAYLSGAAQARAAHGAIGSA